MRIIGHLDMDAFFASVEERDHEWLRGKPLVVGADPRQGHGRGVVSTANYKARKYGIHSGMPITEAWQLSETARIRGEEPATFVGGSFRRYGAVSKSIKNIIRERISVVQEASVDEMYFDMSFANSYAQATNIAEELKQKIVEKEHLTASVGVGPNKLIAKIASDFQKPDGLTVIEEYEAEDFLALMPLRNIPGIGPKTEQFLHKKGFRIVADLRVLSRHELEDMMGKWGERLYEKIRGRSNSAVAEDWETKSLGEQETFWEDTGEVLVIFNRLMDLCASVHKSFILDGFQSFRTVTLTVRFADFETHTSSHTLKLATNSLAIFRFEAMKLLVPYLDSRKNPWQKPLRLIGVRLEKLV